MKYSDKLRDPRWQKKRLEILERDGWTCQKCFDTESTLNVHHRRYLPGKDPWYYENELLLTLCESCHEEERELRQSIESDLLEMLKEKFLSNDLRELTIGFLNLKLNHIPDVVASVIRWSLENENIQQELMERYFESLKS